MTLTATNDNAGMEDTTYERVYTPEQNHRIESLPWSARRIFRNLLEALQDAEEIGGPEEGDYLALMDAIIQEAMERRDYFRITLG